MSYTVYEQNGAIQRDSDGAFLPQDPSNRDYAEYLAWLDDDNTPTVIPATEEPKPLKSFAELQAFYGGVYEGETLMYGLTPEQRTSLRRSLYAAIVCTNDVQRLGMDESWSGIDTEERPDYDMPFYVDMDNTIFERLSVSPAAIDVAQGILNTLEIDFQLREE